MARIEKAVFISYRRTDVYTALAVYQDLTAKGYDVFFDYTSIPSGDFEQIIISNIKARAHFILILTPTALDRCSEPGDWLRREIETAIDEKRNIVPLFFKGFKFGTPSVSEKLTGTLKDISRYNGLNVHEDYFHAAMDRLSGQFLSVPVDTDLHPVSNEVQKVVIGEQVAANEALKKGKKTSIRSYAIGAGILLIAALGIAGIGSLIRNAGGKETPIPTLTSQLVSTSTKTSPLPTQTRLVPTSTITPLPSMPIPTLTPTLGVGSMMVSTKDGMNLLYVPTGKFMMGGSAADALAICQTASPDCVLDKYEDEEPPHEVVLDAFWIDKTEVTVRMYSLCAEAGVCQEPADKSSKTHSSYYGNAEYDDYPVLYVDWNMAKTYCEWVGRRLPTEAEWEKAARGENAFRYPWGNVSPNTELLNYKSAVGDTTKVDAYPDGASPYGAFDMAGNVWEWVVDRYDADYYATSRLLNPSGPTSGISRVIRGGSWNNLEVNVRTSRRDRSSPTTGAEWLGFRCAMFASP